MNDNFKTTNKASKHARQCIRGHSLVPRIIVPSIAKDKDMLHICSADGPCCIREEEPEVNDSCEWPAFAIDRIATKDFVKKVESNPKIIVA